MGLKLKDIYDEYIAFIETLSDNEWKQIIKEAEEHSKDEP